MGRRFFSTGADGSGCFSAHEVGSSIKVVRPGKAEAYTPAHAVGNSQSASYRKRYRPSHGLRLLTYYATQRSRTGHYGCRPSRVENRQQILDPFAQIEFFRSCDEVPARPWLQAQLSNLANRQARWLVTEATCRVGANRAIVVICRITQTSSVFLTQTSEYLWVIAQPMESRNCLLPGRRSGGAGSPVAAHQSGTTIGAWRGSGCFVN
jgi:hypothetical protein